MSMHIPHDLDKSVTPTGDLGHQQQHLNGLPMQLLYSCLCSSFEGVCSFECTCEKCLYIIEYERRLL